MDDKVRGLLERIRSAANQTADAAADTARMAGHRAGQMVDVAKLNVQLFELNREYNDVLRLLGEVMYRAHQGELEEESTITDLLERADQVAAQVTETKQRIALLRQCRPCPGCTTPCSREDKFCRICGRAL